MIDNAFKDCLNFFLVENKFFFKERMFDLIDASETEYLASAFKNFGSSNLDKGIIKKCIDSCLQDDPNLGEDGVKVSIKCFEAIPNFGTTEYFTWLKESENDSKKYEALFYSVQSSIIEFKKVSDFNCFNVLKVGVNKVEKFKTR